MSDLAAEVDEALEEVRSLARGVYPSLLADRGLPITDVALRAGFASQSHFSTAFRRLTNITPGRYRQGLIAGADTRPTGSSG